MQEATKQFEQNKMGTAPMFPLILSMSLPAMFSMLVQALYNVVDSYFVAKLSENALTAVSLVFPIQNLLIAVAVGTGVGINSLISRRLGEGHRGRSCGNSRPIVGSSKLDFICTLRSVFLSCVYQRIHQHAGSSGNGHAVYGNCVYLFYGRLCRSQY